MNCIKYFRLLFISLFCFISTIVHSFEVDGIYYSITSSTDMTVGVESHNNCSGDIIIPEKVTYNGKEYSVTSIGHRAFEGCSGLTSVTIPNSVTSIGYRVFSGCSSLTSVTIPNSVTSIGGGAFKDCSGLTAVHITDLSAWCKIKFDDWPSHPTYYAHHLYLNGEEITNLVIPDDVTSIGNGAFFGCSSLTSVTIQNSVTSIGDYAFKDCSGLTAVNITDLSVWCKIKFDSPYSNPTEYAHHLYLNGEEIINLVIPDDVTSIGDEAFRECSGLTSVTIPNSVTSIGDYAFENCSGLTNVTIPNSVTSIGEKAFYGTGWYNDHSDGILYFDSWLIGYKGDKPTGTLEIKEGTRGIANNAFNGCSNLLNVTIGNSVTSIGNLAFYNCSGMTSVTIGNSVTSIGEKAFYGCSGLASVDIPNSVTSIGNLAFYNCSGMTSVTIGNSVTSIGNLAFYNCSGMTSVTIGNSVTSIGNSAFRGCSGLASVDIPNSVTSIGDLAFYNCSGMTSVTIGNSVTSIGNSAFRGCYGLTAVHITDLSAWCKIQFVKDDTFGEYYNPTLYANHLYLNGEEITHLVIPDDVTSIGNSAFESCSGLTSVTIGNSVTSIGYDAFSGCSAIKSIYISDLSAWYKIKFGNEYANPMYSSTKEVTYVNDMELTDLTIPDSITDISYTFSGCGSLRRLTIPESCKTVPKYAFEKCNNLQELTLPSTCIACYDYSFYGCSSLKNINCQAETPPAAYTNTFSSEIYTKATLNVPEGCADKYKAANIWKEFTNMTAGDSEQKQCAAPVITYTDGKLQYACETEGAKYRYTLTDTDIKSAYTDVTNNTVDLSACYTIKAYAYADGYTNSEEVTATLYWINGSDVSTNINQTEMRGVMATCSGGIITVSGLADGETVMFYDANGALLYTGTAQNGTISYAPSASGVIIVKIGTASIKVVK